MSNAFISVLALLIPHPVLSADGLCKFVYFASINAPWASLQYCCCWFCSCSSSSAAPKLDFSEASVVVAAYYQNQQ